MMSAESTDAPAAATAEEEEGVDSTLHRVQVLVSGKVQGVYYRDTTKRKADQLGLVGAAWNLKDGRVEVLAEGPKGKLEELLRWCRKGPEGAEEVGMQNSLTKKRRVTNVEVTWGKAQNDLGSTFRNAGSKVAESS
mmetsp:Transcript_6815/g.11991  ORF Transcript_6815/g.11991 Transcript_6815/m.11991 type:complete len:136 (-) Transcript_6815:7-414(-)